MSRMDTGANGFSSPSTATMTENKTAQTAQVRILPCIGFHLSLTNLETVITG
jgi:hypothetical protein